MSAKIRLTLILHLFIFGNISAQNVITPQLSAQELRIGSFITAEIEKGGEIWYRVRADGQGVLIVETLGYIDVVLEAYDSWGNFISANDDSGIYSNPQIRLIASAGAVYFFKLKGYGSGTWGAYRIFADMTYFPGMTELPVGASLTGGFELSSEIWYSVKTAEAGLLIVDVLGDDIGIDVYDEFLAPYGGDANIHRYNNRIEMEIKPDMVIYYRLKSSDSETAGAFQITAGMINFPEPLQLAAGTFHSGYINREDVIWYSVRTAKSGYLAVWTTGNTDTYFDVYDNRYNRLDSNDDGGDQQNARITIAVQANQTYIFKLRGYSRSTEGAYRIFADIE